MTAAADVPEFLDVGARALLDQPREAFFGFGLDRSCILEVGRDCVIPPWVGGTKLDTLTLALLARHFKATAVRHAVEVRDCSAAGLRGALEDMVLVPSPDGVDLARLVPSPAREKYDPYLTDTLLTGATAVERLEASALPEIARSVLYAVS